MNSNPFAHVPSEGVASSLAAAFNVPSRPRPQSLRLAILAVLAVFAASPRLVAEPKVDPMSRETCMKDVFDFHRERVDSLMIMPERERAKFSYKRTRAVSSGRARVKSSQASGAGGQSAAAPAPAVAAAPEVKVLQLKRQTAYADFSIKVFDEGSRFTANVSSNVPAQGVAVILKSTDMVLEDKPLNDESDFSVRINRPLSKDIRFRVKVIKDGIPLSAGFQLLED
jgi:hypothetical protein